MTRRAQGLLLVAMGLALVWITIATDEFVNYVQPALRWPLIATALVVIALGIHAVGGEHDDDPEHGDPGHEYQHGHDHAGGPKTAWLLWIPVVFVLVVAPPALGVFTADRGAAEQRPNRTKEPPPLSSDGLTPLDASKGPVPLSLSEFIGRAHDAQSGTSPAITNVPVKLTGFATRRKRGDGWYLTRLQMACCAGDALPIRILVTGTPPPRPGAWITVIGTWKERHGNQQTEQEINAQEASPTKKPKNPYE